MKCSNEKCNKEFTKLLKIAERKVPELEPCPQCNALDVEQVLLSAPGIGDPIRLGVTKKDSGFTEVLKGIHAKTANSTINSYF